LILVSYVDLPDLASLGQISSHLARLSSDIVLHRNRLRVVTPSRIQHSLFGTGPRGFALRPTIVDLVQRNVLRGLNITQRYRNGEYLYTKRSVDQYKASLLVDRGLATRVVSRHLRRRSSAPEETLLSRLHQCHVYPDVESSSFTISRSLLPVMRRLKWCFLRDKLAKVVRDKSVPSTGFAAWLESRGQIVVDSERIRLALCPDVRRMVKLYEKQCIT